MLAVENLRKIYKDTVAVDDISFQVAEGQIFGLLGPNGAGKTTTIRTILNIIKPTSGKIWFNGNSISKDFFNTVGYLPEERGLYRKSKVLDVIAYFAELKNMPRSKAVEEARVWLWKLEIGTYADKKIEELSKGNQQKVQFITSVIHDPKLLILDEPFSGFDPINQQLMKETILSFVNSGKIIILSTHQMETAEKLCSQIFLLNKGKEVCSGSLQQLKKKFGTNNVKIEFEGDANFLSKLPFVKHIDNYKNYAEVQLIEDFPAPRLLKEIVNKIDVTNFSIVEPTLNKIFIDVISGENNKL